MANHPNRLLLALAMLRQNDATAEAKLEILSPCAKLPHLGVARDAATILEARGHITLKRSTVLEENRLQLTPAGVAEAARLRIPVWRRWMADRDLVGRLACTVVGAVIGVVGTGLVRLFWH